jgi:hypothetical protein
MRITAEAHAAQSQSAGGSAWSTSYSSVSAGGPADDLWALVIALLKRVLSRL